MFSKIIKGVLVSLIATGIVSLAGTMFSGQSIFDSKKVADERPASNNSSSSTSSDYQNKKPSTSDQSNFQSNSGSKSNSNEEDYTSYINASLNKSNVSVTIIDGNGKVRTEVSNEIANIYKRSGKSTSTGLIRSKFIEKPEFQELREGNSSVIEKLRLKSFADYLAIGKIQYSMRNGKLVDGTVVCSASITMCIISTNSGSIEQSFTISNANGNGVTLDQAQEDAFQKLLDRYFNEHSTL